MSPSILNGSTYQGYLPANKIIHTKILTPRLIKNVGHYRIFLHKIYYLKLNEKYKNVVVQKTILKMTVLKLS